MFVSRDNARDIGRFVVSAAILAVRGLNEISDVLVRNLEVIKNHVVLLIGHIFFGLIVRLLNYFDEILT